MLINPEIRKMFADISKKAVELSNVPDEQRKYLRRMIEIFRHELNDNERIFILKELMAELSHKAVNVHPDQVREIYSVKLLFVFQSLIGVGALLFFTAVIFRSNSHINEFIDSVAKTFKLFGI